MKKSLLILAMLFIASCLMTPINTMAAAPTTITLNVPIGGQTEIAINTALENYIKAWYGFVVGTVAILATVMIMWAGFKWLTSRGNASIIGDAKDIIWSSIIGLLLAFLSYTILQLINPSLTTIKMPALDDIKFTPSASTSATPTSREDDLKKRGGPNDTDRTDGRGVPVNAAEHNQNSKILTDKGILINPSVRLDGMDPTILAALIALQTGNTYYSDPKTGAGIITLTSAYRPWDPGSQHALGLAADFRRDYVIDEYMKNEVIKNYKPVAYYKSQPIYEVTYRGKRMRIIDEPINNCWHVDTKR